MTENYHRKNIYKKNQNQSLSGQSTNMFDGSAVRKLEEWEPSHHSYRNNHEDRKLIRKPIKTNRIFAILLIFIIVSCCFASLYVNWQVNQVNQKIQKIQFEESELVKETEMLIVEKAENLKYENIEAVAEANGMKTEMDRVKDIDQNEE
ncbi:cell division protein FtsL [Facklamia sp. 7083-14-GEN3]|uniref:cell division protein FtsL n=1 Tax=Facklamia sp. 7083-14-GEN3 TaxID=2973478 RepID=UPI00215CB4BB|nr:cell division protein FtsL [Facklamia sp. 7083-14-GEN3]MCR8969163.1 cell division protein FtsL [Facklamia sp. 7083-14-GEN3]